MIEIIQQGFGFLLMIIMFLGVWESTKIIEEKKERQRRGLTDYYDNPINRSRNG